MVFRHVLFHSLVANQQDSVFGVPKVFAEQVDGGGVVPHDFIDDDVGRQFTSFHSISSFPLLYSYYNTRKGFCQPLPYNFS